MTMDQEFSKILRDWYRKNGRKLPWRDSIDAYKIWLSEIILQQTRVDQGLPYFLKFIEAFPTVESLANAPIDKILRLWQGLGYYSRARNLHIAAKQVVQDFNGRFPSDFSELKKLKGVGEYTAAAIASFAYNLPTPVVDGNVYRFLARFAGISTPIDAVKGKKEFAQLASELLDPTHAAEHNQAMMEIGALICKPALPACDLCPFSMACHAFIYNSIDQLPVKEKKQKVRKRYFHYFFITNGKDTVIRRRNGKDIWEGLYEFPLLETNSEVLPSFEAEVLTPLKIKNITVIDSPHRIRHLLSHQELIAHFWMLKVNTLPVPGDDFIKVKMSDLTHYAFPQLIVRFLEIKKPKV